MTQFETSEHAKMMSQLDNHNGRNLEYWGKQNETKTN